MNHHSLCIADLLTRNSNCPAKWGNRLDSGPLDPAESVDDAVEYWRDCSIRKGSTIMNRPPRQCHYESDFAASHGASEHSCEIWVDARNDGVATEH